MFGSGASMLTATSRWGTASSGHVIVELTLVGIAIWLATGRPPTGTATWPMLAGCILALASAGCAAMLIIVVAHSSPDRAVISAPGLQLLGHVSQ